MPRPFADLVIIKVMGRRDFHRARAFFRIRIFVRNNRNAAAYDWQVNFFTYQIGIALIIWMNRDTCIAEHGFRARGRDDQIVTRFCARNITLFIFNRMLIAYAIGQRVAQMPVMAIDGLSLNFNIGNRALEMRVPVHQPFGAVNQALLIHINKGLRDRFGHFITWIFGIAERELLARPITAGPKTAKLLGDIPAAFLLPLPNMLKKLLAAHFLARFPLTCELTLDDHLRGNARMVRPRLPEHVFAAHTLKADEDILDRIINRMTHMQIARYIGRRDNNGIGFKRCVHARLERAGLFPHLIEARLGLFGVERFIEHNQILY